MQYLTVLEAAKFLGRSDKTVRKYITTGKITGVVWENGPYGRRQMLPLEALEVVKNSFNSPTRSPEGLETLEKVGSNALVPMYDAKNMIALLNKAMEEQAATLERRLESLEGGLETRLEERDRALVETMRLLLEQKKKKPLIQRLIFWRD